MNKTRIIIVEDESIVAADIGSRLCLLGYSVAGQCATGEEAVSLSEQLRPDLVLLDIRLAGKIDGITAGEIIRSRFRIPIIFLTAHADDDTLQRAKEVEPYGYLLKPFKDRELKSVIEIAVYRHQAELIRMMVANLLQLCSNAVNLQTFLPVLKKYLLELTGCRIIGMLLPEVEKIAYHDILDLERELTMRGNIFFKTAGNEAAAISTQDSLSQDIHDSMPATPPPLPLLFITPQGSFWTDGISDLLAAADEGQRQLYFQSMIPKLFATTDGCQKQVTPLDIKPVTESESLGFIPFSLCGKTKGFFLIGDKRKGLLNNKKIQMIEHNMGHISITLSRLLAEENLRKSVERFRLVADYTCSGEIWIGPEGKILWINPAFEHITGYGMSELLNLPVKAIPEIYPEDREIIQDFLGTALVKQTSMQDLVFRILTKGKDIKWVSLAYQPIYSDKGNYLGLRASLNDITDKKLMEEDATQAAKLAYIGEIAAGISHEINNPTMGIINYAQILLDENQNRNGDTELPALIIKEGQRIAKINKSLLAYARNVDDLPTPCSLKRIIDDVLTLLQKTIKQSGITVKVDLPQTTPLIMVQHEKAHQVFANIISNAFYALNDKYPQTNSDKTLCISTETVQLSDGQFQRITFFDNGTGIPLDYITSICEPFITTKPPGMGTGLGLSISLKIVKDFGGRLLFETKQGEYTKVFVDLPLAEM